MSEKWSPFHEAENNLDQYQYFFPDEKISEIFAHPQEMEDWLQEHCPENYCYVWVWGGQYETNIVGRLTGVPKHIAMPMKLMTGVDQIPRNEYRVTDRYTRNGNKYRMVATSKFKDKEY